MDEVPANGVYVLFEKGEAGHGGDRIVRVGTHRGQNKLAPRIREHLYTANKDRSIFRKHVGRCLLAKANDPFLVRWELDLTTRKAQELNASKVDKIRLGEVESHVTRYLIENFTFVALSFDKLDERLRVEARLLSTISQCPDCGPSASWLGKFHPNSAVVRDSGLWNVQSMKGAFLSLEEAKSIVVDENR